MHSRTMSKVDRRKEQRRELILQTAEQFLADKGFHETGIADIASKLGMGHGTFYSYFKNKQDIAEQVLQRAFSRFVSAVLVQDPGAGDSLEHYKSQVSSLLMGGLSLAESEPAMMHVLFEQSYAIDRGFLDRMREVLVAYTIGFLENGIAKGYLRSTLDVPLTSQMLVALLLDGSRRALQAPDMDACVKRKDAGMLLMFEGIAQR